MFHFNLEFSIIITVLLCDVVRLANPCQFYSIEHRHIPEEFEMDFKLMLCTIAAITWRTNPSVAHESSFNSIAEDELAMMNLLQAVTEQFNSMLTIHFRNDRVMFNKVLQVDGILDEDWSDMERIFPYNVTVAASPHSSSQVVLNLPLGIWDLTEFPKLTQTDIFRYVRYTTAKMLEDASRKAWMNFKLGQSYVPKFDIVVDLEGMKMHEDLPMEGVYKERFIQGGIKALVSMGKGYTIVYRKAVDTLLFVNVPYVSSVMCEWTHEESFHCRKECRENENNLDGMERCEIVVV